MKKIFFYISEISLPSKTASPIQIFKMCDAFSSMNYSVSLFTFNNKLSPRLLKKNYNIKKKINIINYKKDKTEINFFYRMLFSIFVVKYLKKKSNLVIYGRSLLTSIFLSFLKIQNFIEIHQEPKGFTLILFNLKKLIFGTKYQKFIFIHKNLVPYFSVDKNNYIIKDDAVSLDDFKIQRKAKIKDECLYTGGLYPGKGLEIISKIAFKNPKVKFTVYGDTSKANYDVISRVPKNVFIKGFIPYNKIPKVLKQFKIILMPYSEKITINAKNSDVSNYISPLKLFEYLASGNIIVASKIPAYAHILKNNFNAFLVDKNNIDEWSHKINFALKEKIKIKKIKKNAQLTAKKFTWNKRAREIIKFINKND